MRTVAGVPFVVTTLSDAVDELLDTASGKRPAVDFRLANAYCVVLANQNSEYGRLLRDRGINLPDGQPVALSIQASRRELTSRRVRGPSFFALSLARSAFRSDIRHFFLGSTDETLRQLLSEVRRRHSTITISGTYSPPFAPLSVEYLDNIIDHVRAASPTVVWVGMGTPKQDAVCAAIVDALQIPAAGVGAAFDFVAGTVIEAPRWVQNSGFEWLYRLVREPRRLWRRYLIGNAQFIYLLVKNTQSTGTSRKRNSAANS